MKPLLILLLCVFTTTACNFSSSKTKEACLNIYKEGTEKILQAKSQKEISDISFKVAKQLADMGNGPEGEQKLNGKDQLELYKAQTEFYQAIEQRARQLIPASNENINHGPIIRNVADKQNNR